MEKILYSSPVWRHPFGLYKLINLAKLYGYNGISVRGSSLDVSEELIGRGIKAFGYDMLGPSLISQQGIRELDSLLTDNKLYIHTISVYVPSFLIDNDTSNSALSLYRKYFELANKLGAKMIEPVPGSEDVALKNGLNTDSYIRRITDGYIELSRLAKEFGIGVLIEPNEGSPVNRADICKNIIERINRDEVRVALDPVNLYFEQEDLQKSLDLLVPYTKVIHAKNVKRTKEGDGKYNFKGYGYEYTNIAKGDIDWSSLIKQVTTLGYNGPIMYEPINPFKLMNREYWEGEMDILELISSFSKFISKIS